MVICGECGKFLKMLNNAHLKSHGLTPKEYDAIYPSFPRYDVEVRKGMGKTTTIKQDLMGKADSEMVYRSMEFYSPKRYNSEKYKKFQTFFKVGGDFAI